MSGTDRSSRASVSNTTIEESDNTVVYSGKWDRNRSPNFSGGGTAYTQADKASVSFSFKGSCILLHSASHIVLTPSKGSAVYVFGDKKNDHGFYNVYLDNAPSVTFNGVSGCGGAFGMTCEQQQPCLKYFGSNLNDSEHTLRIENLAGVNQSFFGSHIVAR
jgi:hypothetical protein